MKFRSLIAAIAVLTLITSTVSASAGDYRRHQQQNNDAALVLGLFGAALALGIIASQRNNDNVYCVDRYDNLVDCNRQQPRVQPNWSAHAKQRLNNPAHVDRSGQCTQSLYPRTYGPNNWDLVHTITRLCPEGEANWRAENGRIYGTCLLNRDRRKGYRCR